ncbi:MAG: hypothetical protein HYT71_00720 [Candidatus Aenigmarchaeota archaeon]|nr:hypothetical protein [Candidatus Aenigmarchaeota archaeon]
MTGKPNNFVKNQKLSTSGMVAIAILVILGAFYALAPHDLHISSGFGYGLEHTIHLVLGFILLAAAAAYYAKQTGMMKK